MDNPYSVPLWTTRTDTQRPLVDNPYSVPLWTTCTDTRRPLVNNPYRLPLWTTRTATQRPLVDNPYSAPLWTTRTAPPCGQPVQTASPCVQPVQPHSAPLWTTRTAPPCGQPVQTAPPCGQPVQPDSATLWTTRTATQRLPVDNPYRQRPLVDNPYSQTAPPCGQPVQPHSASLWTNRTAPPCGQPVQTDSATMCMQTAQLERARKSLVMQTQQPPVGPFCGINAATLPTLWKCNSQISTDVNLELEEAPLKGLLIVFTFVQSNEIRFLPVSHCVWHDGFHRSVRYTNISKVCLGLCWQHTPSLASRHPFSNLWQNWLRH